MTPNSIPGLALLKRCLPVTRAGQLWLAVTLATFITGLLKEINLLLLLASLLLAVWVLNLALAGRRIKRLQGRRWVPHPLFAGTPFTVEVEVTNPRRAAQVGLRLDDGEPACALRWFVPRLAGRQTVRLRQEVTLPRRGRYAWGALRAWSGHPFGLAARQTLLVPAEEIVVLPRLGRLHRGRLRRLLAAASPMPERERRAHLRDPTAQTEFHGLRTFRSGDSPRWIHWRTSARCGELMVREFEALPTENLLVVLDLAAPDNPQLTERAISFAATVCWEWCRQKGDRLLLASAAPEPVVLDGITGPAHAVRLLEHLAMLDAAVPSARDALLARLAATALPRASVLLVSTGVVPAGSVEPGSPVPSGGRNLPVGPAGPAGPGSPAPPGGRNLSPDDFARRLGRELNRPVACTDVTQLAAVDYYEGPADDAY